MMINTLTVLKLLITILVVLLMMLNTLIVLKILPKFWIMPLTQICLSD
jgi:hypothetical protein